MIVKNSSCFYNRSPNQPKYNEIKYSPRSMYKNEPKIRKGPNGNSFFRSCLIISNDTRARTEEIKIIKITPYKPVKLPKAAISLISPPPRESLLVINLKIIAIKTKRKKPKPAPSKEERREISFPGNNEKIIPIIMSGRDNTSGIIL